MPTNPTPRSLLASATAKRKAEPYPIGSRHILRAGTTEAEYEWVGREYGWSTPGTRWCTSSAAMHVLGWVYVRPASLLPTTGDGQ